MHFNSKKKLQSKLPGFEDVFFTLKKMTEGRRIALRTTMAPLESKLRNIGAELSPIFDQLSEGKESEYAKANPIEYSQALSLVQQQTDIITTQIDPAWLQWGLSKIEGLKDDDGKALVTADDLINDGPPELYREILEAIKAEANLSPEQTKN